MSLEAHDLVELAMKRSGAKGNTDLARMLDLGIHGDQRVRRWRDGENEPDYEATMRLLELVGALRMESLDRGSRAA